MKWRRIIGFPGGVARRKFGFRQINAKPLRMIWLGFSIFIVSTVAMAEERQLQDTDANYAQEEFSRACASCHGKGGRGNGPIAKSLRRPPTDLTKLSKNNNGVFPVTRLYAVIDGRVAVTVHGPRQMPVWGTIYTQGVQARMSRDYMSQELLDSLVRVRILVLIEYISTLQEQ